MASFFSHLDPTPRFPACSGPYPVGTTDLEIPASTLPQTTQKPESAASTIAFRIFYPCQPPPPSSKTRPVRWISAPQHDQLASVWRFLGLGPSLSSWLAYALPHLTRVSIPAHRDAPVAAPSASPQQSSRWPVFIFSHGLGGSRNAYSYLCGSLASYGIVVAAPDHRDGSQPISFVRGTEEAESAKVQYRKMNHQPCDETFSGRDEQLQVRIWEINALMEALTLVNNGTDRLRDLHDSAAGATTVCDQLRNCLDLRPGAVTFAGHSFGGTTMVQLLKSVYYRQTKDIQSSLFTPTIASPAITSQVTPSTPIVLLDPWGLSLTNPAQSALRKQPMPSYQSSITSPPLLTIMSEAFYNWRGNRDQILEAVSPPPASSGHSEPRVFYPSSSAHLSQSDFGLLFPRLTRYLAKAGEPKQLIDMNVRAIIELLRQRGIKTESMDLEKLGESQHNDEWVDLGEAAEAGDTKILSHEPNVVEGWNFVPSHPQKDVKSTETDGAAEEQAIFDGHQNDRRAEAMGTAEALVVHGRKRSEWEHEKVDSGTEEDVEGIIESGRA